MMKQHKWKMNRAGLLNFWYYDDEIFDFADGKLLLRGSNGSGKSVTMQSILPVLLDGKKSPDRLDPFGSKARKMEDYLLGEKDIVDRDERTGYLFLEYKREDTNQYITTGIGLQARRHKSMNFWGFVITDNRRIGHNFPLYEIEHHGGEKQKIPLSRVQLENRIADGGHVVRTQGDYMKLVNKYIFGFETMEAYEDLIKLLIQLRSPKLSKDFKPTVIYEILEAALPPLTDEDLRHLSDTIEHMDQTKQQIEQLEREQQALTKLIKRYDAYNEFAITEQANAYLQTKKRYKEVERKVAEKVAEEQELADSINLLREQNRELTQSVDVLEQKRSRLQSHKVWNLEEEQSNAKRTLEETRQEYDKKSEQVTEKKRQELSTKDQLEQLEQEITESQESMNDQLLDLEADAETASFSQHALNEQDFNRNKTEDFDFTVWSEESENHSQKLESISDHLRTYEQLKKQIADMQKKIADVHLQVDQARNEEKDWTNVFQKDKQEKQAEIHQWAEQHAFLEIGGTVLQQVSRNMEALYEPYAFETVRAPFVKANNAFQMRVNESIATANSKAGILQDTITEKEKELAEWKQAKDPEPPNQRDATKEARAALREAGKSFIPFYEAVEFQDHVPDEVQQRIEAALLDSGWLDALITAQDMSVQHDRVIQARPNMMAHTLADYLVPDLPEDATVSAMKVDEVLQSVLVGDTSDEQTSFQIQEDGSYYLGLLHGHAIPVETVKFIGRNARKRYREEQIARITAEITDVKNEQEELYMAIDEWNKQIQSAMDAMDVFPSDEDLQMSFQQIKEKRFLIEQLNKELQRFDQDMQETSREFHTIKRTLETESRGLDIPFSYDAYIEAKQVMRRYEKSLHAFQTLHINFRHQLENKQRLKNRADELTLEVDDLNGEMNVLDGKMSRTSQNINEIEKQMEMHGVADIREQIQEVQANLRETNTALAENQATLPKKEEAQKTVQKQIEDERQKIQFLGQMTEAWSASFSREAHFGFVTIPDELETIDKRAEWISKTYADVRKEKEQATIEGQLTSVFFEQQSNLMEYRMADIQVTAPEYSWMNEDWADEQRIQIDNWKQRATRRLIQLDFQGKRVSPYYIQQVVEKDQLRQQHLLDDQDRKLYEEILFDSVGKKLRSRISRAQHWTEQMNKLMENSDSSSGLAFSIRWKPRTAETEEELDTKELVDLLRRDPRLLKDDDIDQVIDHFRSKIDRAKEMVEMNGEGSTLLQVLKEVLDYRNWFSFVLSFKREGEPKRELTNHAFYQFSGGEKAMAMYIPLFTACYSRYSEADRAAPYIISLDEAFAGVDEDNISVMFAIVEELGFDYIMNSQVLWGDYETISALSICELIRPKNQDYVTVIRYYWDGNKRSLVTGDEEESEYIVQ